MDPDAEELTFPQQSPFVATLDNLATNAFYDVAIKREASKSSAGPQWFEPVPSHIRYPFTQVRVPKYSGFSDAKELSEKIKNSGNNYFKRGEYWEALWKYEHALFIARSFPQLTEDAALLHCNIAAACLKLGNEDKFDLLEGSMFPPSTILWFVYTQQHTTEAINFNPPNSILCKAHYRRGESFKIILNMPQLQNSIQAMCGILPNGSGSASEDAFSQVIADLLKCIQLQSVPDPKIFSEIIVLAVKYNHCRLLPPLLEHHVKSEFPSQILQEMLKREDVQTSDLHQLLVKLEIRAKQTPHFDGSKVSVASLLKRGLGDAPVFQKLCECGMRIDAHDFVLARELYRKKTITRGVYEFVMSKQKNSPEEQFFKLKQEGNVLFSKGSYELALGLYYQALNHCRTNGMVEEMAVVRANCAQACLKLQLYSDAYSHADQCITLNPSSHKGYFRRGEALRAMLESRYKSTPPPGTYKNVVKDYLESHAYQANADTFLNAIKLVINNKDLSLDMIPRLLPAEVRSGFADEVLRLLLKSENVSDRHLRFLLFDWPQKIPKPFDGSKLKIMEIAPRVRDSKLYEKLFSFGLEVTDDKIVMIVHFLPDECAATLHVILNHIKSRGEPPTFTTFLNVGCSQALVDRKYDLIVCMMQHGATPGPKDLRACEGVKDHPLVLKYLEEDAPADLSPEGHEFSKAVATLNKDARVYFKSCKYPEAIQLYKKAVELCQEHKLKKEEVTTHLNLSLAYLRYGKHVEAYTSADACVKLNPRCAKGFYRRAEALKKCVDERRGPNASKELLLGYRRVIDDICRGNLFEPNAKAFAEAVVVAIEYKEQDKLPSLQTFPKSFLSSVLNEVIARPDCDHRHLHSLVCKIWSLKDFSAADVSLKRVLSDIGVTQLSTIQRLFELGMKVKEIDASTAIDLLKPDNPNQLQAFKLIASKCPKEHLDKLCTKAFRVKKTPFVFSFIECGSYVPGRGIELLELALKTKEYITGMEVVQAMSAEQVAAIDLGEIINTNLVHAPKLLKLLIECGANPNGLDRKSPVVMVLSMEYMQIDKRCELVCILLMKGADCNHLCRIRKGTTTPLHVATEIALQADGNTTLISAVLQSPTFNPKKLTNDKQETPLHLAVKSHRKREPSTNVLKALLEPGIIDLAKKDKSGRRVVDLLSKKDSRIKLIEAATRHHRSGGGQSKKKRKKGNASKQPLIEESADVDEEEVPVPVVQEPVKTRPARAPKPQIDYSKLLPHEKVNWLLERLLLQNKDYFIATIEEPSDEDSSMKPSPQRSPIKEKAKQNETKGQIRDVTPVPREISPVPESDTMNSVFVELGFNLDTLPWEVEGTEKIVKFFKDVKRNSEKDRVCAARIIFSLAEGHRNWHLAKPVSCEPGLSLYESKITKAARLLWEKAITYSSKLTGLSTTPVYTQIIRVWDIVLDHDALERKIKACTEQIECSHRRGRQSSVKWILQPQDTVAISGGVRGREMIELPMRFLLPGGDLQNVDYEFVPAASTKQDEYNITTFVSFDTISFKSILLGTNERRDYPFKEWQKEHEIIKLCTKEAILLLGRSGTGKTTCCLYRLWNEYKEYWNPQSATYNCKLPRRALVSPMAYQEVYETEDEMSTSDDESLDEDPLPPHVSTKSTDGFGSHSVPPRQASTHSESGSKAEAMLASYEQLDDINTDEILVEEDLHQVFVTKNYVLCDQIKKRFFNMVAAHDFLSEHLDFENSPLPNSFSEVDNLAFPIFLTARQFYIILDNSLDGETFFRRDADGNVSVKVSSMDYDHEDAEILLDLEESDSEGEEGGQITMATQGLEHTTGKQHVERWTEVTALYFKEVVWPTISHQCHVSSKDFDPLLVWIEIQSFIKGSETALRKGSPLNCSEYLEVGNKMAPNFSSDRETIFKLFQKYQLYLQRLRHSEFLFDECELMHNLYKRLQKVRDVPWSFHSVFIDEVQDFTQAELAVFIHCCRDPNSMLFTGDTAQSIMRGIAFRFEDLRSLYHQIHQHTSLVQIPQKPYRLTINFRSHSGVLKLAGSVIDLISEFFKDSIDQLPDDEGMFPGPTPVLVESCEVDELALLLSANKRKSSAIEFGAHQAVIVQSKESKERLPDILKGAIVLTIFEAKGLEFDDVLLYNFFTDSLIDEKGWRVISSYLEMDRHQTKILTSSKLPGASAGPRSRPFDPKLHKSLNAELKYLYTAITRTKCNLWIYDSNQKSRLPMFDYWHKRELVKVVRTDTPSDVPTEGMYKLVFASNSTTEQWKAQGDNFRKKHLWEQARLCYERSGETNKYLVKEAQAYQLVKNARHQKPSLYFEAALLFLECDHLHHGTNYLTAAALCLRHAKPSKLSQAGKLYELLGESSKACQVYLKARDFERFIRLKESIRDYSSVVMTLLGKPFMRKREALMKAREYEVNGIELAPELSASKLSYSCAKFYAERKDKDTLVDVLQHMPETERRVRFLKESKLYDQAITEYERNKQYSDACRLAAAQGWFDRGHKLAVSVGNQDEIDSFILQRAKSKYKHTIAKSSEKFTSVQVVQEVGQDVIDDLSYLFERGKKQRNSVSTYAALLLGMITSDKGLCRLAWRTFKLLKHKIGELEAFNQLQELADESTASVLEVCQLAKEVGRTFQSAKDINNVVHQGLKFYDIRKVGQVYCLPRDQDIWMPDIIQQCQNDTEKVDIDGMHRLDTKKVRACISEHCADYIKHWVNRFQLDTKLPYSCDTFSLHKPLLTKRFPDREYAIEEVSSEAVRKYIQSVLEYLELRLILDKDVEGIISLLLALFSPQVTRYLPQRFNEHHVGVIRNHTFTHTAFTTWLEESTLAPAKNFPERVSIDQWLTSWRACCLFSPDMTPLFSALEELETLVKKAEGGGNFKPPAGFVFKNKDKAYYHVFSMWLLSCHQIRDNCDVLWGSRLAIYHFVSEIASSQCVSISVANMVDVLSLHCTVLLAIVTHVQGRQNRSSSLTVPLLYKSTVQLFDSMVSHEDSQWKLLQACAHEIGTKQDRGLPRYFQDSRMLLIRSLDILLGAYKRAPWFSVLKFALKKLPHNDDTRHCLILTLTIFGNLIMLCDKQVMAVYHEKLMHIFTRIQDKQETVPPDYVKHVIAALSSPTFVNPREVFGLVDILLHMKRGRQPLAKLVLKQVGKNYKVDFIPLPSQPNRLRMPPRMYQQPPLPPTLQPVPSPQGQISNVMAPISSPLPPVHTQQYEAETSPHMQPSIGSGRTTQTPQVPLTARQYPTQPSMFPTTFPQESDAGIFPFPSYLGRNPLVNHLGYGYNPAVGDPGEAARLPQPPMGAPQIPVTARESTLPSMATTNSSVPSEEDADSVNKHVVASYSIDELRQLASSNQEVYTSDFEFSYDSDFSDEEQGYLENEEDGGFDQALSSSHTHLPLLPPVDPELVDPTIVSQGDCSACGVSFSPNEDQEGDSATTSSALLYAHVTSEAHRLNTILCKRFLSIVDSEESEISYPRLSQKLHDLVTRCEGLKESTATENLYKLIDSIKESNEKNDIVLTGIQDRLAWREGIQKVSKMLETMDKQLFTGEKMYKELAGELHKVYNREISNPEELDAGELEMLSGQYEEGAKVEQGSEVKRIRTAAEKQMSRQRKREKKERRGGGNNRN